MKTILITGSNRGIGRAIAEELLDRGHELSLGIRDIKSLEGTKLDPSRNKEKRILVSHYDALVPESSEKLIRTTIENFKKIDVLINCAGIFTKTGFLFNVSDEDSIEKVWKVNLMAPWRLTKDAWNELSKSKNGRVIFLVSMSGKRSKGNLASYSMSKFALMSLCQTMRNEGWDKGIRVTAICPGWVNTEMAKGINTFPKKDMTQTNDIADICSSLLKLPSSSVPFEIALNCQLETNN